MLYGFFWQEVFPWPTPEDETPKPISPVSGDYIAEVLDLEPGQVLPYMFDGDIGVKLVATVEAMLPIDVVLCTYEEFERWQNSGYAESHLEILRNQKGIRSAAISLEMQRWGLYSMVLVNPSHRSNPIIFKATVIDKSKGSVLVRPKPAFAD